MSDQSPSEEREPTLVKVQLPSWRWIFMLLGSIAAVGLASLVFLAFFRQVKDLLIWVVVALFASFALEPAVDWLAKRGWRRGVATGVILFGLAVFAVVMVALMIPLVVTQLRELIDAAPDILRTSAGTPRGGSTSMSRPRRCSSSSRRPIPNWGSSPRTSRATCSASRPRSWGRFQAAHHRAVHLLPHRRRPAVPAGDLSVLPPKQQETVPVHVGGGIDKTGAYLYSRLLLAVFSGVATFIVLSALGSRSRCRSRSGWGWCRSSSPRSARTSRWHCRWSSPWCRARSMR